MDFIDVLRRFSARAEKVYQQIQTEEATKTSLIMPFFQQVFGYDVFNPDEFVPEFVADVGIKKGEKVDYAIFLDGVPVILIEAKWCGVPLEKHDSQLFRYFGTTKAKFAILTNGIIYKFYTDLEEQNKMDLKPFWELDLLDIKESLVPELKRFCKANFDVSEIFSRASELKYSNEIKVYFSEQLREPSDEFVKFMLSQTYEGVKTVQVIEKFRPIVKSTLNNLIGEMMSDRITSALKTDASPSMPAHAAESEVTGEAESENTSGIVTTEEEIQGFFIVKAILAEGVDISKVSYKDTINYFSILFNGMPTKWICRLRITPNKMQIGFPNESGVEIRNDLASLDELYKFKDELLASARRFFENGG
ncbi:MAG: type I restriction enzyme HsdR N-terminal domain-containing protein [Syntrophobacterales bacterium]|jgi:hypothetical protein|nr:type I restriction enzyme HsdR N-terminal domain-containing protein [Syntrophobacterales bacterium]